MGQTKQAQKQPCNTGRRAFCRKIPCAGMAMMFDSQFPWLDDPDVSTSACPDAYNPVIFEISRKPES